MLINEVIHCGYLQQILENGKYKIKAQLSLHEHTVNISSVNMHKHLTLHKK